MDGEVISAGYLFSLSYVMSVQFQDHGCHLTEDRCCVLQGGGGGMMVVLSDTETL